MHLHFCLSWKCPLHLLQHSCLHSPGCSACLQGWGLDYFRSSWHVVDFLSVGLMVVCIIIWWEYVIRDAIPFDIQLRWAVTAKHVSAECTSATCRREPAAVHRSYMQSHLYFAQLCNLSCCNAWQCPLQEHRTLGISILLANLSPCS